jgi:hypothetical protein
MLRRATGAQFLSGGAVLGATARTGAAENADLFHAAIASIRPLMLTSASFLAFAFGLQHSRPLQNFALDFCLQVQEILIIAAVVSVFGKSLRNINVIISHGSCVPPALILKQTVA